MVSATLFLQRPACSFLGDLVSWNGTILYLPSSFQAGSSGFSFNLQSLCTSGRHYLLFHTTMWTLHADRGQYDQPHHDRCPATAFTLMQWLSLTIHSASTIPCSITSVGFAQSSAIHHATNIPFLNFLFYSHRDNAETSIQYHTATTCGNTFLIGLLLLLTKKLMTHSCSSFVHVSLHTADFIKLVLPHLPHAVDAVNPCWWLSTARSQFYAYI